MLKYNTNDNSDSQHSVFFFFFPDPLLRWIHFLKYVVNTIHNTKMYIQARYPPRLPSV